MNADKLADAPPLEQVVAFLLGEDEILGFWFGETPAGRGNYWWRTHLRDAWNAAEHDAQPAQAAQPVGEMPSDAVQMQPEPPATELQTLLNSAVATLRHARTFITSREKMHPTGVELYDDLIEQLDSYTEAQPVGVPDGWVMVPKIPTSDMADAARRWQVSDYVSDPLGDRRKFYNGVYWAMLHAAPQPTEQPSADAEDMWRLIWMLLKSVDGQIRVSMSTLARFNRRTASIERIDNPDGSIVWRAYDAARAAEGDGK